MIYCNCRFRWGCSIDYPKHLHSRLPFCLRRGPTSYGRWAKFWWRRRSSWNRWQPWQFLKSPKHPAPSAGSKVRGNPEPGTGQNVEEDLEGMDYEHHPILFFQSPFSDGVLVPGSGVPASGGIHTTSSSQQVPLWVVPAFFEGLTMTTSSIPAKLTSDETDSGW